MAVSGTSSSSLSSMLGVKNNGIGGLVSGLDTDSLVDALTSGIKSKIAKQGQNKQLLNWKMTAYRSMSSALKAFQTKTLSYQSSANTNISSASFFNTYKASSSSSKVSVSANSSSTAGTFTIDSVQQLATSASLTSKTTLSSDLLINLNSNSLKAGAFTGQTLALDVGGTGKPKTIKLDDLNDFLVETSPNSGEFRLDFTTPNANGKTFQQTLQGLIDKEIGTKTVNGTPTSIVSVSESGGIIKLDSDASKIIVAETNTLLGVTESKSNRISLNTKLGDITAFQNLQGDVFKFSINGTEISVNRDDTLSSLISKIKNSNANVNVSYSEYTDELTITSKTTGGGNNLDIRDVQGNLMNQIFGAQGGYSVGSSYLISPTYATSQGGNAIWNLENKNPPLSDDELEKEMKALGKNLKNMEFSMTINGVTKIVKLDTSKIKTEDLNNGEFTHGDLINAFNAGIKSAFGNSDVTLGIGNNGQTYINTNGNQNISVTLDVSTTSTNFNGAALLGFTEKTSNVALDLGNKTNVTATNYTATDFGLATDETGTISMTINGKTVQLGLNASNLNGSNAASYLNSAIEKAFGKDVAKTVKFTSEAIYGPDVPILDEGNNPVLEEDGITEKMQQGPLLGYKLSLNVSDPNTSVTVGSGVTVGNRVDIFEKLGFGANPINNATSGYEGTKFSDLYAGTDMTNGALDINGTIVLYSPDMTIQDFITKVNDALGGKAYAGISDGKLSITSVDGDFSIKEVSFFGPGDDGGRQGNMLEKMFGITGGEFTTAPQNYGTFTDGTSRYKEGKYAEVIIDGKTVTFSSNTISYNGVSLTLNSTSIGDDPITITVESDPEEVLQRIKDWMDDYNALVYTLNQAVNESKDSDYFPLTDDQKADMTQDQIKTWEAEAKKGILRNDSTLKNILSEMRTRMFEKVEAAGISLFDIGITTKGNTGDPNENGQLQFDTISATKGEDRLRQMLTNEPDKVRMLFTDTNGLAARLNTVIDKATNPSSTKRGTLVTIAGSESLTGDNTSTLGKKISAIDTYIKQLKTRYESEYSRQWKKFSALEVAVQKMSAQSSWLQSS